MRLIEPLKDRRHQSLGRTQRFGRPAKFGRGNAGDRFDSIGWVQVRRLLKLLKPDGVLVDELGVDLTGLDNQADQPVHHGEIGSDPGPQVNRGAAGDLGNAGVDHDELRRVRPFEPIQSAGGQNRLRRRDVVPRQKPGIANVDIGVGRGLTVRAERLLQGPFGRRRAKPSVAVLVRGADARLGDHGDDVVFLDEKLARAIEGHRLAGVFVDDPLRPLDDQAHRLVPGRGLESAVAPDERLRQAVLAAVGDPSVKALGPEPPPVDLIIGPTTNADDLVSLDANLQPAAV